jgi:hypothetical protein
MRLLWSEGISTVSGGLLSAKSDDASYLGELRSQVHAGQSPEYCSTVKLSAG